MLIALTSDSHGSIDRLQVLLDNLSQAGITHLLHCGDFAVPGVVEILKNYPDIQIHISLGNADVNQEIIDQASALPNCTIAPIIKTTLGSLTFALSHIQGLAEGQIKDADIYCHGHTHRPRVERRDDRLILNPGSLCPDDRYAVDGQYLLIDTEKPEIRPLHYSNSLSFRA